MGAGWEGGCAVRWWPCEWRALGLHSLSGARCSPPPLTRTPPDTPWEEVCCTVAALNQHGPNEVSHLTPSSLRPSLGCQSHKERASISSAWLTRFDSWDSLGPVSSKLPLSKCHHPRIHQPHLWAWPLLSLLFRFCFFLENNNNNNKTPLQIFFRVCVFYRPRSSKHPDFLGTSIRPSAPNGSRSPPRCWWAWPLTYWPKTLLMWAAPGC